MYEYNDARIAKEKELHAADDAWFVKDSPSMSSPSGRRPICTGKTELVVVPGARYGGKHDGASYPQSKKDPREVDSQWDATAHQPLAPSRTIPTRDWYGHRGYICPANAGGVGGWFPGRADL